MPGFASATLVASQRSALSLGWSSLSCSASCRLPTIASVPVRPLRQPGTAEIIHRFDELDRQVGESHDKATRNTAIVWVAVAGVAMLGWYKIT
jgi:hypothetical protein